MTRPLLHWLLLGAVLGTAACGGSKQLRTGPAEEMSPLVFEERARSDGTAEVVVRDPVEIFDRARALLSDSKYLECADHFDQAAALVPDSRLAQAALHNAGLCLEYAERYAEAVTRYRKALERPRDEPQEIQLRFRLATVLEKIERWSEVVEILEPLADRGLVPPDTLAVRARLGLALLGAGRTKEAEGWLKATMAFWKDHNGLRIIKNDRHAPRAAMGLARIADSRFDTQPLRLPLARMRNDLDTKTRLFLRAQSAYLEVVQMPDVELAVQAGLAIGHMFERLYDGLMAAQIPAKLDAEEREIYFAELRRKIRPLLFRAADIYRTNASLARSAGRSGDGVDGTEDALERIRSRIERDLQTAGPVDDVEAELDEAAEARPSAQ